MENYYGEWVTEEEDDKEIAERVFNYDKKGLIDYVEKVYAEQGDNTPIKKDITFEELWKEIDHDIFREYECWEEFEEQYIRDWREYEGV